MTFRISMYRPALVGFLVLISASAVAAQATSSENKASAQVNVTGVLAGHAIGTDQAGILQAAGSGTGTASHIGHFRYLIQATVNSAGNSEGVFLLVFSDGDVIYGSLVGHGPAPPPPPPEPVRITEQLTITGGTGRFQGSSGTITLNRVLDLSTEPNYDSHSGTLTGTISFSRSSK
jgi:hypothetical protein